MISMRKPSIPFVLGLLLALILPPRLHTQTAAGTPAINAAAPNPTPVSQAPDEATQKITELVHAGKYPEAQQLTTGLLVAYPNDQRLIKAKALIEKLLSPAGSPSATPGSQSASSANAAQLTGMDKVEYNSLIELARQAQQQTTDLEQQRASLKQFMDRSSTFLQKHPEQMLVWQLRAASAISLNDPMAGYEAGQKLLAAGVAESNDPNLQRLLAQLNNKHWLEKEAAEKAKEQQRYILVSVVDDALRSKLEPEVTALLQSQYPRANIRITIPDANTDPVAKVTINVPFPSQDCRSTGTFVIHAKCHLNSKYSVSVNSPAGLRVDHTFILDIVKSDLDYKDVFSDKLGGLIQDWTVREVLEKLKVVLNEDAVRTALAAPSPGAAMPVSSSAPINSPVPGAPAPASEPALQSSGLMNTPTSETAAPDVHSYAPVDNPTALATASDTSVLHVYRPHHLTGTVHKPYIYVDGKKIALIANSQEIRMLLASGKHTISVATKYPENDLGINDLDMAAGSENWIRVDISAGAWAAHWKLHVVPTDQAQLESKRMEKINIGDVPMH